MCTQVLMLGLFVADGFGQLWVGGSLALPALFVGLLGGAPPDGCRHMDLEPTAAAMSISRLHIHVALWRHSTRPRVDVSTPPLSRLHRVAQLAACA